MNTYVRRREFIAGLGGAGVALPFVARAQQPAMPVIGFLGSDGPLIDSSMVAFRQGLNEAGYVEGQNVEIDFRFHSEGGCNNPPVAGAVSVACGQLRSLAEDLVRRRVALIVAVRGIGPPLAAKAATSTIPIVFAYSGGDPVKYGLVKSLNRPGGNITGVIYLSQNLGGKRLNLLRDLVPQATKVAFLGPDSEEQTNDMLAAAQALGRQLIVLNIRSSREIDEAFSILVERGAGALVVGISPNLFDNRDKLLALAAHHMIPTIYPFRTFALNGGLMSYAGDTRRAFREAALYVGRILKGTKPADLPVQLSTRFELVVNLKTAKALGLTVPPLLLVQADEVIE